MLADGKVRQAYKRLESLKQELEAGIMQISFKS